MTPRTPPSGAQQLLPAPGIEIQNAVVKLRTFSLRTSVLLYASLSEKQETETDLRLMF